LGIGTATPSFIIDVVGSDARLNGVRVGLGGGNVTDNTALGVSALNLNTSGTSNLAISYFALAANITGSNNTAVGSYSLRNSTQSNNTGIGSTSFLNLTSGQNNTALGRNSARYIADGSTSLTISQQSIFIGADTKALANSQTNQIVIGYNAIGLGSNSVVLGNSSVTLTALRGNVLIGTTTDAGFRLDVNGTARIQGETTIGNGTNSVIRANSASAGNFNTIQLIANTSNNSTMFEVRPNGTSTDLTGFLLRDSATGAANSNVVIIGRGNATLPSTGVSYYGTLVANNVNANSLHLGFLISNVTSGRTEVARIWNSGNFSIQNGGTFTDIPSARLAVNSTTQGFLPPRMTTTEKNAIASPVAGLVVYDTTLNKLCVRTASSWETITSI
jgi:hypothetical protein